MKKIKLSIHDFMSSKLDRKSIMMISGGTPAPVPGDPPPSNGPGKPIGPSDPPPIEGFNDPMG